MSVVARISGPLELIFETKLGILGPRGLRKRPGGGTSYCGVGVGVEDRTKVVSCPYESVIGRWVVLTMLRNAGRVNPDLVLFSLLGVVELDVPLDGLRRLLAVAGSLG